MSYTLTFRKRAASEYIEAAAWYNMKSIKAAENFVKQVNILLDQIEQQPSFFRKSFKHFHEAKVTKYPYKIIYFIDEEIKRIVITSLFHQKRNPLNKYL